jgi:hypothetical protein
MIRYYEINEDAARRAKEANSYDSYKEGSATAAYRAKVDAAAAAAKVHKAKVAPEYYGRIDALLDKYAKDLAAVINRGYEIEAMCPSILISGGGNFPVKKKERQNAARDANMKRYQQVEGIISQIQSTGMGGIRSDEDDAIGKLKRKLASLEEMRGQMKEINADARRRKEEPPYLRWQFDNLGQNIRRIKARIAELEAEAEREPERLEGDGYHVEEDPETKRIRFFFDGKPDERTRELLKSNGFRWSPSRKAWQRLLSENGRKAARRVAAEMEAK